MKKLLFLLSFILCANSALAAPPAWMNDSRSLFLKNDAVILEINIRTFSAKDKNHNDEIEKNKKEESGNFIDAISRLDDVQGSGVNMIHVMPIMKLGKIKALGNAGSLYALSSFTELNPQLDKPNNNMNVYEEARQFINEAHARGLRVIVDLPSCGAYDLYLSNPDLFIQTPSGEPVIPADWTDVRLFKVYNSKGKLNEQLYNEHKKFIDLMLRLGVDGIRADVATIKPYEFWQRLINYTRSKDKEFLFLAEASEAWTEPVSEQAVFTPYKKLLDAGFDGYYGSFAKYKEMKTKEFANYIKSVIKLEKSYNNQKRVIGAFATHDEISPILTGKEPYTLQLFWLNATLPLNAYFTDGIQTGDSYLYDYANKKSPDSTTDDDFYVHKGKIDIFNFSRQPGGEFKNLELEFITAGRFKRFVSFYMPNAKYIELRNNNPNNIYTFARSANNMTVITIVNRDMESEQNVKVNIKHINKDTSIIPIKTQGEDVPKIKNGAMTIRLAPGEIQVLLLQKFSL